MTHDWITPEIEADVEKIVDRRVMRRLATDRAYLHADNAEEQAEREEEITDQELERERLRRIDLATCDRLRNATRSFGPQGS